MFSGVDCEGKTVVFGISLIKEDSLENFSFAISSFFNSIENLFPSTVIIERQSTLKNALESVIKDKDIALLYCYQHLHKSLQYQIRNLMYTKNFSEKTKQVMLRVEKLPKLDNHKLLQVELERCKKQCEEVKGECNDIYLLVNKLYSEVKYWAKHLTIQRFTAGVNVF